MQKIINVKQHVAVNVTIESNGQVHAKKFFWKDGKWFMEDELIIEVTE